MSSTLSQVINQVFRDKSPSERAKLFEQLNASRGSTENCEAVSAEDSTPQTLVAMQAQGEAKRLGLRVDADGRVNELDFRAATKSLWPEKRMAVRSLLCQAGMLPL